MSTEINKDTVKILLPKRDEFGHKGTFGKVVCICGSVGFTGAPVFSSKAAMLAGCGLVYLVVPQSVWSVVASKSDEVMVFPAPDMGGKFTADAYNEIRRFIDMCDVVLIGPGLGINDEIKKLVKYVLTTDKPVIMDADAINALKDNAENLLSRTGKTTILTPHEGEFLRVFSLEEGRELSAQHFTRLFGVNLVLKGHNTVVADPDGNVAVNTSGNCGMAKGGSGDILTGLIAGLLAQGMNAFDACCSATYLHGLAGDLAAEEKTAYGMLPTDILNKIPNAFKYVLD